jgi:hypothetical protein
MQEEEQGWGYREADLLAMHQRALPEIRHQERRDGGIAVQLLRTSAEHGAGRSDGDHREHRRGLLQPRCREAPARVPKGYQGVTYDTWEVMFAMLSHISNRDDVIDTVTEAFDDDIWVERNMFSLNGVKNALPVGSILRSRQARGEMRTRRGTGRGGSRHDLGFGDARGTGGNRRIGMIRTLPADRVIYRVRAHKRSEECTNRETLGPPPSDKAPTNRMSAAGVSVFYGAFERATAVAEASMSMPAGREWILTAGAWQCARSLQVLDLSELPPVPSLFAAAREWRGALLFLREFVKSISAPVVHDGGEHIEYVPTQILTEHFRKEVAALDGSRLDGIVYPSARRRGGKSLVVFRSRDDLDPATLSGQEPLLKLDQGSVTRLRRARRRVP